MSAVEFRRAGLQDTSGILRLQAANLVGNLSVEERRDGFLSAEFTPQQIAEMADDVGIIIAADQRSVFGFLCGFRRDFNHQSPVIAKMIEQFDRVESAGRTLNSYNSFIYGPVCIDRAHRGRGLLRRPHAALQKEGSAQLPAGVAFVARNNPHSLQAHVKGLGMVQAGEFELNGNVYVILAFRV